MFTSIGFSGNETEFAKEKRKAEEVMSRKSMDERLLVLGKSLDMKA